MRGSTKGSARLARLAAAVQAGGKALCAQASIDEEGLGLHVDSCDFVCCGRPLARITQLWGAWADFLGVGPPQPKYELKDGLHKETAWLLGESTWGGNAPEDLDDWLERM